MPSKKAEAKWNRRKRQERKYREPKRRDQEGELVGPPRQRCPFCGAYLRENESETDGFVVRSLDCPKCGEYSKYLGTSRVYRPKGESEDERENKAVS